MSIQTRQERASAVLNLLHASIRADDQGAFDFLTSVVCDEGLYDQWMTNDGRSIASYDDFMADLKRDAIRLGNPIESASPTAVGGSVYASSLPNRSLDNVPLCRLTTEQRYQLRQAENRRA